jgi:glycerol-3-phosphate O-acyltransferase / dihydroxyacetone phosphate acyltransferase
VYRKQDHPGLREKNEGTLEAAASALIAAKAITIFPEGKSHSDPQLSDIKTGCARIALRAVKGGAALRIVPVGLTYAQKHRFRSKVQIEVGTPIVVPPPPEGGQPGDAAEIEWVRTLTRQVADGMREVTLNLEQWADLKVVETAAQLYAMRLGEKLEPERVKRFARGMEILRRERPEELEVLREDVMSFRQRLDVVAANPGDLPLQYRRPEVARFVGRNLASLLFGFPLFLVGIQLFVMPFMIVRLLGRTLPLSRDRIATFKFVASLVMVPLWQLVLSALAWNFFGTRGLVLSLVLCLPLALFTRYFYERRRSAARDAIIFLRLGNRVSLKAGLLAEGERLSDAIEELAEQLKPRVMKEQEPRAPSP